MLLYADEDFPFPAILELRRCGHDVLTHNRRHYERLHRQGAGHSGILSATQDPDHPALAARIHSALAGSSPGRWCLRVNRPPSP
jgi:hypothetical protein